MNGTSSACAAFHTFGGRNDHRTSRHDRHINHGVLPAQPVAARRPREADLLHHRRSDRDHCDAEADPAGLSGVSDSYGPVLFFPLAAWLLLGCIAFATLSPIAFRPRTGWIRLERFEAFAVLGVAFVLADPHHSIRVTMFVVAIAVMLELLQNLIPDR